MSMLRTEPAWDEGDIDITATWLRVEEPPAWTAERLLALLDRLHHLWGDGQSWKATDAANRRRGGTNPNPESLEGTAELDGSLEQLERLVASGVSRYEGQPQPRAGYTLGVWGGGNRMGARAHIAAGSMSLGRRIPAHQLMVELRVLGEDEPELSPTIVDEVCTAIVEIWEPAVLSVSTRDVFATTRRGAWKIPFGYRVWLSDEIGRPDTVTGEVTAHRVGAGTMLKVPDHWPADHVVTALTELFDANGLDEIPR